MANWGSRLSKLAQALATAGTVPETQLSTAETDTSKVLAPDGAGGVEFRAEAGGEGASGVGYLSYAYTHGLPPSTTPSGSATLAASGGTFVIPIWLSASMLLESITLRQAQSSGDRELEFRLYYGTQDGTVNHVVGANGSLAFTPVAASNITITATGAPVTLIPDLYWLAVRNIPAATQLINGTSAASTFFANMQQSKTLGSALGSTLDMTTGWTKSNSTLTMIRLNGRVFGESTAY